MFDDADTVRPGEERARRSGPPRERRAGLAFGRLVSEPRTQVGEHDIGPCGVVVEAQERGKRFDVPDVGPHRVVRRARAMA